MYFSVTQNKLFNMKKPLLWYIFFTFKHNPWLPILNIHMWQTELQAIISYKHYTPFHKFLFTIVYHAKCVAFHEVDTEV